MASSGGIRKCIHVLGILSSLQLTRNRRTVQYFYHKKTPNFLTIYLKHHNLQQQHSTTFQSSNMRSTIILSSLASLAAAAPAVTSSAAPVTSSCASQPKQPDGYGPKTGNPDTADAFLANNVYSVRPFTGPQALHKTNKPSRMPLPLPPHLPATHNPSRISKPQQPPATTSPTTTSKPTTHPSAKPNATQ